MTVHTRLQILKHVLKIYGLIFILVEMQNKLLHILLLKL